MKPTLYTRIANNEKLATGLVVAGIFGSAIFNAVAITAAYFRGMRKGVDIRDDYYYEKEIDNE